MSFSPLCTPQLETATAVFRLIGIHCWGIMAWTISIIVHLLVAVTDFFLLPLKGN